MKMTKLKFSLGNRRLWRRKRMSRESRKRVKDSLATATLLHDALDIVPSAIAAGRALHDVAADLACPAGDAGPSSASLGHFLACFGIRSRRGRSLLLLLRRRRGRCGFCGDGGWRRGGSWRRRVVWGKGSWGRGARHGTVVGVVVCHVDGSRVRRTGVK